MKRFVGRKHKGDTLVEVTLAIGIFSMVAVAAVSVINISTTGAQSSLESTITREEIDGQAEALRFIQSAYIAGGEIDESNPTKFANLWQKISSHAIDLTAVPAAERSAILKYNPTTCDALYTKNSTTWDSLNKQNAFIINTHAMNSSNLDDIIIDYKNNNTKFGFATTYPRIVYGGDASDALYNPAINNLSLFKAEGIYVIAVRDMKDTVVVTDSDGKIELKSAYIDFYIRSCWFTPNATRASTISTVIRLYDPDKVSINKYERKGVLIRYGGNGASTGAMSQQYIFAGETGTILANQFVWPGHRFKYWTTNSDGTGTRYNPGNTYTAASNITSSSTITLYAQWEVLQVNLAFNANGGSGTMSTNPQRIAAGTSQYIATNTFTRTGYSFSHWNTKADGTGTSYNNGARYEASPDILNEQTVTLYAQWSPVGYTLTYDANGGSNAPAAQTCYLSTISKCYVTSSAPTRSGYEFLGWADSSSATAKQYSAGSEVNITGNKTIYAVWRTRDETITIKASWSGDSDYDSFMKLQKPDGTFVDANYSTRDIYVAFNGITYSLITGAGDGRGSYNEIRTEDFTIHTLGGKNYYYSIRRWPDGNMGNDITITVSGPYLGTKTFYSSNRSCNGNYWNVFAYKDGLIVERNTCSSSIEYNY